MAMLKKKNLNAVLKVKQFFTVYVGNVNLRGRNLICCVHFHTHAVDKDIKIRHIYGLDSKKHRLTWVAANN